MAEHREDRLAVELRELGEWLDVPPAADRRAAVRARLSADGAPAARPPRPGLPWPLRGRRTTAPRRRIALVAAAAVLAAVVAAVPQGRAAVAGTVTGLLRFAGVRVEPPHQPRPLPGGSASPLPSTRSAPLERARRLAAFPIGVPAALGVPQDVRIADPAPDGAPRVVTLLYRDGAVRLDEFDGTLDLGFVKQAAPPDMRYVEVGPGYGLWLPHPHPVAYVDRLGVTHQETARLAGPTLVWASGAVTFRLEGVATLDEALRVARSVR
jgi:hypothetical protein